MYLPVGNTEIRMQPQPPRRGVVENTAGGVINVLWEYGRSTGGIGNFASLDKIHDADAASQKLLGKVVRVTPSVEGGGTAESPSGSFDAVVLDVYKRSRNGTYSPSNDVALLQLLSNDAYLEVLVSRLTRLDDR